MGSKPITNHLEPPGPKKSFHVIIRCILERIVKLLNNSKHLYLRKINKFNKKKKVHWGLKHNDSISIARVHSNFFLYDTILPVWMDEIQKENHI